MKLTESQAFLLRILDAEQTLIVTATDLCQQMTGTSIEKANRDELGAIERDIYVLRTAGFVRRTRGGRTDPALEITLQGRVELRWHRRPRRPPRLFLLGVAATSMALVGACSMLRPSAVTPGPEPLVGVLGNRVVPRPAVVQTRGADGSQVWAYCYDDCPQVTPKLPYGYVAPAAPAKNPSGGAGPISALQTKSLTDLQSARYAIFFDSGSATINRSSRMSLDAIASDAIRAESVEITGRTDSTGSGKANEVLAVRRATAVQKLLLAEGVPADRIKVTAVTGSTELPKDVGTPLIDPVKLKSTARRVEITLQVRMLRSYSAAARH